MYDEETVSRFLDKVDIRGEGECWIWTASTFNSGYGQFKVSGSPTCAHRVSWEIKNGPIPEGLLVRHSCHNRICVNPDHLELGTHQDNMDDMVAAGRQSSKLTIDKVILIRHLHDVNNLKQLEIADMFQVGYNQINRIIRREQWSITE